MHRLVLALILASAAVLTTSACSTSHRGEGVDGGARVDAGPRIDAGETDAATCMIECAGPPPGCRYEGTATCDPPRCPMVVCDDGGTECAPCEAPPAGCTYTDACTCSGLVCDEVACGGTEERFPDFDRTCAVDSDCVVAHHTTDCCGSVRAMGIAAYEQMRFDVAEEACEAMYPPCGCFSGLVTADDGTTTRGSDPPSLTCAAGACTTTFAP